MTGAALTKRRGLEFGFVEGLDTFELDESLGAGRKDNEEGLDGVFSLSGTRRLTRCFVLMTEIISHPEMMYLLVVVVAPVSISDMYGYPFSDIVAMEGL
jgi:hypothetical protein